MSVELRVLAASIGWSEEFTGVRGQGSKIRQPPRRSGVDGYFKVAGRCCGTECTRNPQTSVRYHSPRGGSVRVKSGERFATMESGPPLRDAVRVQDRGSLLLSSRSPLRRRVSLLSGSFARRKNCFPVGIPLFKGDGLLGAPILTAARVILVFAATSSRALDLQHANGGNIKSH